MSDGPWMLVTAWVDPASRVEFETWFRDIHLPHVLLIPGLIKARRVSLPPSSPNYAALYFFADDAAVREALASAEAQQARSDWEAWSDRVRDLSVHFYTNFAPSRTLFRYN